MCCMWRWTVCRAGARPSAWATSKACNSRRRRRATTPTDYTIRKGDDVQNATLATNLVLPDGQKFTRQADEAVTVNTGKPTAPVIIYPNKTEALTSPLVIRGKATPHTQVRVKVDYSSKLLGLLPVQGTAADAIVTADKNGNWKTDPIDLNSLLSDSQRGLHDLGDRDQRHRREVGHDPVPLPPALKPCR